ncbi:MAG: DUF4129 domain-containing protein [Planctomycetaceae bacterium]|nr:DUF4129 domain-containing protein [Planctomycetales bacterium]MCB9922093.1 DUF4129 domain-containing protein [Planctomycetaceae bacterium]
MSHLAQLHLVRAKPRCLPSVHGGARLWCIVCVAILAVLVASPSLSQELADDDAVEAGRNALDGSVTFPWYDPETDGIRRLDAEAPKDLKNRGSKWERTIQAKKARTPWSMPDWLWTMLEVLGWTLLVMALVAVGYFLVRAFLVAESGYASGEAFAEGKLGSGDVDRVENLPFQLDQPRANLLETARRLYEAGKFSEAIIYLYSHQLVELDKRQLIRLTKGKTNRQYLRELKRRSDLFASLQATMFAFEDVFFGNHPIDRSRFEACWNGLDAFHLSLERAMA